jgi:hypothetical protein
MKSQTLEEFVDSLGIDNVRRLVEHANKRIALYEKPKVDFITFANGSIEARVRRFKTQAMLRPTEVHPRDLAGGIRHAYVTFSNELDTVVVFETGEVQLNDVFNMEMFPQAGVKTIQQVVEYLKVSA